MPIVKSKAILASWADFAGCLARPGLSARSGSTFFLNHPACSETIGDNQNTQPAGGDDRAVAGIFYTEEGPCG
jgi:hypothetical protein